MSEIQIQRVAGTSDRSQSVLAEFDDVANQIRAQAWNLFSSRGGTGGHALDDWLAAERAVCWPAAELEKRDGELRLKIALAGFEQEEITVTATPNEILVKADHEQRSSDDGTADVRWSEFRSNRVFRRIELPEAVDVDQVSARFRNGLLKIKAPTLRADEQELEKLEFSTPS